MAKGASSSRAKQPGLALVTLCLLMAVDQTHSQDWSNDKTYYESWNYGRNRLIREMREDIKKLNDRYYTMDNNLAKINKVISIIREASNIPLTTEERLAELKCPENPEMTTINTTFQCMIVAKAYATFKEATDACTSVGGYLAVVENVKLLGNFLVEKDAGPWERSGPMRAPFLTHDTFWIGADSSRINREPGSLADPSLRGNLCATVKLDLNGDDHKVVLNKPCDQSQRYPFLCEFDSGSKLDSHPMISSFSEYCPVPFRPVPFDDCIFFSHEISEPLDYSQAAFYCERQGGSIMRPKDLRNLMAEMNGFHSWQLEEYAYANSTELMEEYGIWLDELTRHDDLEWDMMLTNSGNEDMCLLLKGSPTKTQLYKEIAECSSKQKFLCNLDVHPKMLHPPPGR